MEAPAKRPSMAAFMWDACGLRCGGTAEGLSLADKSSTHRLPESGELKDVQRKRAAYLHALFAKAQTEWDSRPAAAWIAEYGRQIDAEIRSRAARAASHTRAARLSETLNRSNQRRGGSVEASQVRRRIAALVARSCSVLIRSSMRRASSSCGLGSAERRHFASRCDDDRGDRLDQGVRALAGFGQCGQVHCFRGDAQLGWRNDGSREHGR